MMQLRNHYILSQSIALILAAFATCCSGQTKPSNAKKTHQVDQEKQSIQVKHLAVLGMKLPRYKAENLTPEEALKLVWSTALQEEPAFGIRVREDPAIKNVKISLDLADVPCAEVIQYIAELTASDWQLRGWSGIALTISLKEVGSGPGEFNVVGRGFPLGTKSAALLGLHPDMAPAQVMAALSEFGASFDPERDEIAGYDAKHGVLAVACWHSEANFVESLVRLANAGMKIELPAKQ